MLQNREALYPTKDIEGLVRFGIDLKEKDRRRLAGLDDSLVEDFAILGEGEKPKLGRSLFMFVLGLLAALGTLAQASRSGS